VLCDGLILGMARTGMKCPCYIAAPDEIGLTPLMGCCCVGRRWSRRPVVAGEANLQMASATCNSTPVDSRDPSFATLISRRAPARAWSGRATERRPM